MAEMERVSGLDLVQRWRRACFGFEPALRPAYLGAEFERHAPDQVASALDRLCSAAEHADGEAQELLVAAVDALSLPSLACTVVLFREIAIRDQRPSLARLLRTPVAETHVGPGAGGDSASAVSATRCDKTPDYGYGRPLTLGERKALARRPTRALLARLLADPHPAVIEALLDNPRLVEQDVLELVGRRPASGEVLAVVAKKRRWSRRRRIRIAIILNPDAPLPVTLPLLALLVRTELAEVAKAAWLDPLLRSEARARLELGRRL